MDRVNLAQDDLAIFMGDAQFEKSAFVATFPPTASPTVAITASGLGIIEVGCQERLGGLERVESERDHRPHDGRFPGLC